MVVIVANCNLYIPDTSIHQDIVLDTVDGTLPMLSSVFPVSVGQILLLGSISQMGKLRNMEVKHSSLLISVIPFRVTHYFSKYVNTYIRLHAARIGIIKVTLLCAIIGLFDSSVFMVTTYGVEQKERN